MMEQQIVVSNKTFIKIAKIGTALGLKGELKLISFYLSPLELKNLIKKNDVFLYKDKEFPKKISIDSLKVRDKFLIASFLKIKTLEEALLFKDYFILVHEDKYKKYLSDINSVFQYIGFSIYDEKLGFLGIVTTFLYSGQILVALDNEKIFPFVDNFIKSINIKDKKINVNLPEGLFL